MNALAEILSGADYVKIMQDLNEEANRLHLEALRSLKNNPFRHGDTSRRAVHQPLNFKKTSVFSCLGPQKGLLSSQALQKILSCSNLVLLCNYGFNTKKGNHGTDLKGKMKK